MSTSLARALAQLERQRTLRRDVVSARVASARRQLAAAQHELEAAQTALRQAQALQGAVQTDTSAVLHNPLHPALRHCSDALVLLRGQAVAPAHQHFESRTADLQRLREEALARERQLQRSQELLGRTRAALNVAAEQRLALEEEEWRPGPEHMASAAGSSSCA